MTLRYIVLTVAILAGTSLNVQAQEAGEGTRLRIGNTVAPTALDPVTVPSSIINLPYLIPIYDRLMNIGSNGQPIPMLAMAWKEAEDGLSWSIDLREGVTFSDGTDFNAEAAKANLDRYRTEGSEKSLLAAIDSIETVGDHSIKVLLKRRDNVLPLTLVGLAGAMASPASFDSLETNPVGSGPYILDEALPDRIVYKRRDGYWDTSAQKSETVELIGMSDTNARINGVVSGQIDVSYISASEVQAAQSVIGNSDFGITPGKPNLGQWILYLNTRSVDPRIRKAVSIALDRKTMAEVITGGACTPLAQAFSPPSAGHLAEFSTDEYLTADIDGAKALVAEAGAEGLTLDIIVIPVATSTVYGQVIQAEMAKIGIKVNLITLPTPQAFPTYMKGDHHGLVLTADGPLDPGLLINYAYAGGRNLGEPPAEIVDLAAKAADQELGSAERAKTFEAISRFLMDNPIHVPLCANRATFLHTSKVIGLDNLGISNFVSTADIRNFGVAQ